MNGEVTQTISSATNSITSTLDIAMAMVNDSGNYLCQASNTAMTNSAEARVLVQSKVILCL